jgi:hypothetical protein
MPYISLKTLHCAKPYISPIAKTTQAVYKLIAFKYRPFPISEFSQ